MNTQIAFFIPSLERGGVERTLVHLAHGLVRAGYRVEIVTARARPEFVQEVQDVADLYFLRTAPYNRILRLFTPPRVALSLAVVPALTRYLRKERPAVMVSFQSSVIAVWAARLSRARVPVVVRESNTPSVAAAQDRYRIGRWAPRLKRMSYPRAAAVITNSGAAADDLARVLCMERGRIRVIYNPTVSEELERRAREPVDHPWFRDGEPPVVLGVGRLTRQKDFATLVKAFARVRVNRPCRLVILGEGEERAELERLVQELGLNEAVDLPGFVSNPYTYMARAAVFVLSSRYEGLPNALIEALACGTPVVATDAPGGAREVLLDGAGGELVPVGDVNAMAAAIEKVLRDPEGARRKLEQGRAGLDRFRAETAVRKYIEVIETVLS